MAESSIGLDSTYKGEEKSSNSREDDEISPPYTIFSKHEKYLLIIILSLVGYWSTSSSPIYFPALPTLTRYFKTSETVMNLSVVAYLIFQGISPIFSSNLADTFGRRPVIVSSIIIYVVSCIAISQSNVYWLLVVLRCLQAASIAPVIAISSGVAGDVCTAADRGGFVGIVGGFQLVGNGFGGLIGAALINSFHTWRSIFIFLSIGGGITFVLALLLLPETARNIVGNGSVIPKHIINRSAIMYLPHFRKKLTNDISTLQEHSKFDLSSPFRILIKKQIFCTLLPAGIQFASWTMVLASVSTVLESDSYNYSVMHVGLIYLPQGISCLIGSLVIGRVLNWYYSRCKRSYDEKYKDHDISNRPQFNIYKTRLYVCLLPAILMIIGLIIFGWSLEFECNISSIIIATMLVSFSASSFMSAATTMLVDLYPGRGSTSTSCMNLVRCWLAAAGAGLLSRMTGALGLGGCYTLMAGLCLLADLLLAYVVIQTSQKLKRGSSD